MSRNRVVLPFVNRTISSRTVVARAELDRWPAAEDGMRPSA
jgi:hypothetical protein